MIPLIISPISPEHKHKIKEAAEEARRLESFLEKAEFYSKYTSPTKKFAIPVSLSHIHGSSFLNRKSRLISCSASFGHEKENCFIYGENLPRLRSKLGGAGRVDLLEHFAELVPNKGRKLGLVTYQNGIMNTLDDFERMGNKIREHFPEVPLCIGLYNRKLDLVKHLKRAAEHFIKEVSDVMGRTFMMFRALINQIHAINPELIWIHVMHSEGGAIAHKAFETIPWQEQALFKNNLITLAYGPLMPIKMEWVLRSFNIYSDRDTTTGWFGAYYKTMPEYVVEVVKSSGQSWRTWVEMTSGLVGAAITHVPPGDHSFLGETYSLALDRNSRVVLKLIQDGIL